MATGIFGTGMDPHAAFPAHDFLDRSSASSCDSAFELSMPHVPPIHSQAAISRNRFLQVGFSGALGLGLADLATGRKVQRGNGVECLVRTGEECDSVVSFRRAVAPGHLGSETRCTGRGRGEFRPIDTVAPGVQIGPHLPRMALIADKFAIVRSMTHSLPSHEHATHFVLTGVNQTPPGSTHMASRSDWPCYSATMQAVRPRADGVPSGVMLPTYIHNGYGFSGQTGGFMGSQYDPWHVTKDPNAANFNIDELTLLQDLNEQRVQSRRSLLTVLDDQHRHLQLPSASQSLSRSMEKAHQLLGAAGRFRDVFDMNREPAEVRDRYGRHSFGQSLLLARRLVEAGMPIIQANMGTMNNWDTHGDNFGQLKNRLPAAVRSGAFGIAVRILTSVVCSTPRWWWQWVSLVVRRRSIRMQVVITGRVSFRPYLPEQGFGGGQVIGSE